MPTEAGLRLLAVDHVPYVALADVAALLLDTALTADQHPELTASAALRGLAAGLAAYQPAPTGGPTDGR
ncbi:MAG: hypothetical protein M3Q22_10095 [Actinomycetota bacterium]|nr:hypothetical protein [Actinomycetota bacterium]